MKTCFAWVRSQVVAIDGNIRLFAFNLVDMDEAHVNYHMIGILSS